MYCSIVRSVRSYKKFVTSFDNGDVVDQTRPCPRSNLGYSKSEVQFWSSQTGISIWDDPMAYRIIQKVDAKLSSNLMIFIMQLDSFYQAT